MTWWVRASRASRRPICTAARPPTPASTSSNTIVVPSADAASTTSSASITRDSSPPDALLVSGSTSLPRCAANPNSTASTPSCPACTVAPDGSVSGAESSARAGNGGDRDGELGSRPSPARPVRRSPPCDSALAALVRALVSSAAAPTSLACELVDPALQAGQRLLGDVELRQPVPRLARPRPAHRRCRRRTCGSACAVRPAGPAWSPKCWRRWAIRPGSRRVSADTSPTTVSASPSCPASARSAESSVASSAVFACPTPSARPTTRRHWRRRRRPDSAARAVGAASRSASSSDSRRISATSASSSPGRGATVSISFEAELQPVGFLRQFARPVGAVDQIAAGRQPVLAQRAVALQLVARRRRTGPARARCSSGRISRSWSFWPCRVSSSVVNVLSDFAGTLRPPR